MNKICLFLYLFTICTFAQNNNQGWNFIQNILQADSITSDNDISHYHTLYNEILKQAIEKTSEESENYYKHKKLFKLLHNLCFSKYIENSTISLLFNNKEFNCVTATCIYYAIATDIGLNVFIYESPSHVYLATNKDAEKEVTIDLTDPVEGFDNKKDIDDYIEEMIKYKIITIDELNQKGKEKIYHEYISKSHKIKSDQLLAVYYTNLSCFASEKGNKLGAYKYAKKAYDINRDSSIVEVYVYRWGKYGESINENLSLCTKFLIETMDLPSPSTEFEENLIDVSCPTIERNLDKGNILMADSLYKKLLGYINPAHREIPKLIDLSVALEYEVVRNKLLNGYYEEAITRARLLFKKIKDNNKIQELYLYSTADYIVQLALIKDVDKMKDITDTLYADIPGVKSAQDLYLHTNMGWAFTDNPEPDRIEKVRTLLFDFKNKYPDNILLKKYIPDFFHELSMAYVRKKNYNKALGAVNEGLTYEINSQELQRDQKEIKEMLNSISKSPTSKVNPKIKIMKVN